MEGITHVWLPIHLSPAHPPTHCYNVPFVILQSLQKVAKNPAVLASYLYYSYKTLAKLLL